MSNNDKFKELYKAIGVLAETGASSSTEPPFRPVQLPEKP